MYFLVIIIQCLLTYELIDAFRPWPSGPGLQPLASGLQPLAFSLWPSGPLGPVTNGYPGGTCVRGNPTRHLFYHPKNKKGTNF